MTLGKPFNPHCLFPGKSDVGFFRCGIMSVLL